MNETNSDFKGRFEVLKASHEQEIAEVNLRHQKETNQLIVKLQREIKEEMAKGHSEDITRLKVAHQVEMNELINKHDGVVNDQESGIARLKEEHAEVVTLMRQSNEKKINQMADTHDQQMGVLQDKLRAAQESSSSQVETLQRQLQHLDEKYDDTSKTHGDLIQQWRDLQDKLTSIQEKHEVELEGLAERKLELELENGNMSEEAKKLRSEVEELVRERDGVKGMMAILEEQKSMVESDFESRLRSKNEQFAETLSQFKKIMASKDAANRETVEELESCHRLEMQSAKRAADESLLEKVKVEKKALAAEKFREGGNAARNGVCNLFLSALEDFDASKGLTNVKSIFVNDKKTDFGESDCVDIVDAVKSWAIKKEGKLGALEEKIKEYDIRVKESAEGDRKKEIAVVKAWEEEVKKLRVEWDLKLAAKVFVSAFRGCRLWGNKAKLGRAFSKWKAAAVVVRAEDSRRGAFAEFKKKTNFARGIEKLEYVVKNVDCMLLIKVMKGWMR